MARLRFRHEATALARLAHPGLVPVFDVGVDEDRPFLVMRLIEGETAAEQLPLDVERVVRIATRLAAACVQVHRAGMVHRDIKPANILLDREGNAYLADFGIVLMAEASRLTATDEVVGTVAYLSPEQVLGDPIGPASDIYSLGLVLLECLTGKLEYGGGPPGEVAVARLHRPPHIPDWVPVEFADLIRGMTAKEPAERPSATDCVSWLKGEVPVSHRRRWGLMVGLAAAAASAAAVLGVVSALHADDPGVTATPPAGTSSPSTTVTNPDPTTPTGDQTDHYVAPAQNNPATVDATTTHGHGKGKGHDNGNNGNNKNG